MLSDSTAAIGTASTGPIKRTWQWQFELNAHFVRDAIAFHIVQIKHVRAHMQYADALTKAVDLGTLAKFRELMQGQAPMPAATALYK